MKRIKPSAYLFPLGYIIEVDNDNFNPNTFYNNGVWERIKGRCIVGVDESDDDFNITAKVGGSKLLQRHTHGLYGALTGETKSITNYGNDWAPTTMSWQKDNAIAQTGEGNSGNLQPYYTAYIWKLVSYS